MKQNSKINNNKFFVFEARFKIQKNISAYKYKNNVSYIKPLSAKR